MLILKWLQSALKTNRNELEKAGVGRTADEYKNKISKDIKKTNGVDIINAALVEKAEDFDELIESGSSAIKRKKLKRVIRHKVERAMCRELSDPKIIDEVTERITDVAEVDPYYQNLFCKDAE